MDSDLEIAWHQIAPAPEYEALIREHVEKLERMYPHIISARISVEMLHHQHENGNFPEVHITLQVPGSEVVVSRELHRMNERHPPSNVATAIRQSFKAAEQRLKNFKSEQYDGT